MTTGAAKATFSLVRKMLPGSSEVLQGLAFVTRREGRWDESVAYWEQALALDPRNPELLSTAGSAFAMLRQFPAALELYDRALDILPNNPELMAVKASVYQAEGNLQEAAKLLREVNPQTDSPAAFRTKVTQLMLERNHGEAVRLLQARLAQFHFSAEIEKVFVQLTLAFIQRSTGDSAGAKLNAEQARNMIEPLCKKQSDNNVFAAMLSSAYAALGEKNLALKEAERAIMLLPSAKDRVAGPDLEENLASIQTIFGENSSAISTLTRLLQTRYSSQSYGPGPITPALLRLDPIWDRELRVCPHRLNPF